MNCNSMHRYHGRGHGNECVQRVLSCGFTTGSAKITCLPKREAAIESTFKHVYPVTCPPVKTITIARVDRIAGVDNAVFLVGDVEGGYRQGKNLPSMMKAA